VKISSLPYFEKWLILGIILGIVIGLLVILFYFLLNVFTHIFLTDFIGVSYPQPLGEGGSLNFVFRTGRYFLIPVSLMIGGLLSGLIIYFFAPETAGSGIDYAISSYHYRQGKMRWRVVPVKILASAITMGSGGSAGSEGPSAQFSAGIGSVILDLLRLSPEDRRRAVAVGIGAGIGIIFKTPIGGSLLASEILYKRDLEPEVIYPALVASAIGYTIFGLYAGFEPIFGYYSIPFNPLRLPMYAAIGVISGLLAILYVKMLDGVNSFFRRMKKVPNYLKPLIGSGIAGLIGLLAPEVLSTGEGWISLAEYGKFSAFYSPALPLLALLVLLPILKMLATSFTVSSGGSGGVFVPGLFIGAFIGADLGLVFHYFFPNIASSLAPFVIIGMISFFAAAGKVPLSVLIMVTEMTGSLQLLPGAMIAVALSYLISGNYTIYPSQLTSRRDSPAHRSEYETPILRLVKVSSCKIDDIKVRFHDTVENALRLMYERNYLSLPVVDDNSNFIGVVYLKEIEDKPLTDIVGKYVVRGTPYVSLSSSLEEALEILAKSKCIPVVDKNKLLGIVTIESVLQAYEEEAKKIRQSSKL